MPIDPKPSIDYEAIFVRLGGATFTRMTVPATGLKIFQDEIHKVFSQSNMFSVLNPGSGSEKYHITLMLQGQLQTAYPSLSKFYLVYPAVLTFMIIPAYDKQDYILTVQVKKGDQLLKQYEYKQHMYTWVQLPLMFILMPTNAPAKVEKKVIDNMLLNFLYDSQKDEIWESVPQNAK